MICGTFLSIWALVLTVIGIGEEVRLQRLVDQSTVLSTGAAHDDVLTVLGAPYQKWQATEGWLFFSGHPDQWIYGTAIDLQYVVVPDLPFPNPLPIKLRFFSSDEDDLVLDWTDEGKLSRVKRPTLEVNHEAKELFEPIFALGRFVSIVLSTQ